MILSLAVLGFVTIQRLGELVLANRNTKRLLAEGGVERGADHYLLIVGLHGAWLAGLWLLAWNRPANLVWLGVFALLQAGRLWVLASLGRRWTTRIITVRGEPLVKRGPYRFFPHPNYAVVAGEMLVLPMVFGLLAYALVFSVLNASVLFIRIRAEDRALREANAA